MNTHGISHYMNERIKNNAHLYHHQQKIDEFTMSDAHQAVFSLVFFVLNQHLKEGHTVLTLRNHQTNEIISWQVDLLSPVMICMNDKLGEVVDFKAIFERIYELKDDKESLVAFIDYQKTTINHLIKKNNTNKQNDTQETNDFTELFVSLLRVYYFSAIVLNHDLSAFIRRLENNPFCSSFNKMTDRAIIFHHDLDNQRLHFWLNRSFMAERALLLAINDIRQSKINAIHLNSLSSTLNEGQRQAIYHVANHAFTIITGGPGTGKTFTVAQIVLALYQNLNTHKPFNQNHELNLALVAPTGKASQRMAESLQNALRDNQGINLPKPMTIHRLLGIGHGGMPRYHASNPLPYELIIVDEASMLGTELARHLLCAIKQGARIILLGDAHQLSAVDAGAVLSDLCHLPALLSSRIHLTISNRFHESSGVGRLAGLINDKNQIGANDLFGIIQYYEDLAFYDTTYLTHQISQTALSEFYKNLANDYFNTGFFAKTHDLKRNFKHYDDEQKKQAIILLNELFNRYRILTALHLGYCGDDNINAMIEHLHKDYLKLRPSKSAWYHGRPVMILKNRYDLGLFNGDVGICLQNGHRANELSVYFMTENGSMKAIAIHLLEGDMVKTAYAMTTHKSQGSEFDKVAVVFGDDNERLLSKELIYTAVTRAKKQVAIYASQEVLLSTINTPTIRQTGLLIHDD